MAGQLGDGDGEEELAAGFHGEGEPLAAGGRVKERQGGNSGGGRWAAIGRRAEY
jgi:hypothetical protein